jgi:hypothetical protein
VADSVTVSEVKPRLDAAALLVDRAETGALPPVCAVAGAVSLVWQALEWAYGVRP